MTKLEFNELEFIDKIEYFNRKLREGQTVIGIRKHVGISEKGWQKEVKYNGYRYDTKLKIYIKMSESNTSSTTQTTTNKNNNLSLIENKEMLRYLSDNFAKLKDLLDKYEATTTSTTQTTTKDIVIDLIDDRHLKPNPKSMRINEFVHKDWVRFCEENKQFTKQELVSMALKEYIKNHSR